MTLFASLEYRNNLEATLYQQYLGRAVSSAEIAYYADQLGHGLRQGSIIWPFLAADKNFNWG